MVRNPVESVGEWLMVGENSERPTFQEVEKVVDGQVNDQKFSIEGTVAHFGGVQMFGEKYDRPEVAGDLLENGTNGR